MVIPMKQILLAGLALGALATSAFAAAYPGNTSTLTSTIRERDNIARVALNYLIGY
jgi:hypothetical protein